MSRQPSSVPAKRKAAPAIKRGKATPAAAAPPDPNQMTLGGADLSGFNATPPKKKKATADGRGALGKRKPPADAADYSSS